MSATSRPTPRRAGRAVARAAARTPRRRTVASALVLVLPVLWVLSACVAMPTSGGVEVGDVEVTDAGPAVVPLADRPAPDADPQAIVVGFLKASQAGFSRDPRRGGDFGAAREYLAGDARASWRPRESVVLYPTSSSPTFTVVNETQVQVTLSVAARIDADGRYAEAAPDAEESFTFDLVRDSSDQWRIAGLEDGVVLDESNFENLFGSASLYFLTPDDASLVPETRWFPLRNIATSIVRELLEGPSPWLRDSVRSAIPEGVELTPETVPVDETDSTASVGLTEAAALTDSAERARMIAQIEASLAIPGVRAVEVTAGGVPLTASAAEVGRGVDSDGVLEVVSEDKVVQLKNGELLPLPAAPDFSARGVHDVARNERGNVRVALSDAGDLVRLGVGDEPPATILGGPGLLAPSVDRLGWTWTGRSGPAGLLTAVRADGQLADVSVPWLAGRSVTAVRVARDGARVAVLSTGTDGLALDVAGVVRDASGGPLQLGEPLGTGATLVDASELVWVDDATLGVLGRSGVATSGAYHLVPLSGRTRMLPALEDAVAIAGGKGQRSLYVATSDARLFWLPGVNASWTEVATGVRDPYFPG
ncbi:LpqB family beta-propeller domain-containing protein [Cellulomonas sp. 179-A 4D5 NHS]|uniref:LpqB family beta-propeller domain-containing protein n=1 Tax=Cellulomonas sp. 179-A 4D5 NHS TaxID=3142378 RepID=UPI0039A1DF45